MEANSYFINFIHMKVRREQRILGQGSILKHWPRSTGGRKERVERGWGLGENGLRAVGAGRRRKGCGLGRGEGEAGSITSLRDRGRAERPERAEGQPWVEEWRGGCWALNWRGVALH